MKAYTTRFFEYVNTTAQEEGFGLPQLPQRKSTSEKKTPCSNEIKPQKKETPQINEDNTSDKK
jgi:hypothetical protein